MRASLSLIAVIFLIQTGCSTMEVAVDYDNTYSFKGQNTYDLLPNEQEDLLNLGLDKETTDRIITTTINQLLADKGYRKSTGSPKLLVAYFLVTNAKTDTVFVNQYYGELGYNPPPGRSSTRDSLNLRQVTYHEGILIIDIIDAETRQRVWQGHLTSRADVYDDETRKENRLEKGVRKILSSLPSPG